MLYCVEVLQRDLDIKSRRIRTSEPRHPGSQYSGVDMCRMPFLRGAQVPLAQDQQ